uniref:Integrator complex subunit 2 n=1 Tax=Phallusia mammillata TaxID=59560 RepID=A0A6F9DEJ0_9ASCI|nr:integrator complex subunit 2 [Phallusia mammillata]
MMSYTVEPSIFVMMSNLDIQGLLQLPACKVRPLLPSLVRMSLCTSLDTSTEWQEKRKLLLQLLSGLSAVNDIIALLSVDFHDLEEDARKEQQLRSKMGVGALGESSLISGIKQQGLMLEFERSEPARRFRIVLSELLPHILQIESHDLSSSSVPQSVSDSELFTCSAYFEDVSDVLCILCAELPKLLRLPVVCEALLCLNNGTEVMCKLVANNPESFMSVCNSLLGLENDKKVCSINEQLRCTALQTLCIMNPNYMLTTRDLCVHNCKLPDLAVKLTLHHKELANQSLEEFHSVSGLVAFASGLLLGNDVKVRLWFATYIRQNKDPKDCILRQQLVKELRSIVKKAEVPIENSSSESNDNISSQSSNTPALGNSNSMYLLLEQNCLRASAILRLYCALKAIASVKFSQEESDLILQLITCFPPMSALGIRFVSIALGMLLACPQLVAEEQESQVIRWIKWLASHSSEMENVGPEGCSFAEQLLLTAIHLHGDRRAAAVRLACATLGMRMKVSNSSLNRLKHIFTEEVFPTHVVAAHATQVPVTKNLNDAMTGYLPVHCVYQLLKTRAFSQGRISVKDWIYKQICSATSPLHPQLQPLIQQFVVTIVTPLSKGHHIKEDGILNEPFTEEQIMEVFGISLDSLKLGKKQNYSPIDSCTLTSKLLMLYYVLQYEDSILNNMKTLALIQNRPARYSSSLINQIPVKLLLYKAQRQPKCSQGLYPALLGLLITHLPHLCMVDDWMQDLDFLTNSMQSVSRQANSGLGGSGKSFTNKQFLQGLERVSVNPAPALMHLKMLTHPRVPCDSIICYANSFTQGLLHLLNDKVSRRVRQEAQKLWFKLNSVIPLKLWVLTVSSLQTPHAGKKLTPQIRVTFEALVNNPLLPLNVDSRILKCPDLLPIILRILSACLSASHSQSTALLKANPTLDSSKSSARSSSPLGFTPVSENEKDELRIALNAAQNSAVVQLLIEICMCHERVNPNDDDINLLTCQREVQCLICSQLHQMFIADPNVAKLVHFQGYASEMIPVLVAGVPSMHICLDFIPEMLQHTKRLQHLFAFELASHISLQYPLPKSLAIAKLCINTISTFVTVVPSKSQCSFFSRAIATFPNFTKAFPPLTKDCISILQQLGRMVQAEILSKFSHISTVFVASPDDWDFDKDSSFCKELNGAVDPLLLFYQDTRKTFFKMIQAVLD